LFGFGCLQRFIITVQGHLLPSVLRSFVVVVVWLWLSATFYYFSPRLSIAFGVNKSPRLISVSRSFVICYSFPGCSPRLPIAFGAEKFVAL